MSKRGKNIQSWSWILMVLFFILSIIDIRFGMLAFACMGVPLYFAIMGKGKIHCSHYCPRGSFLKNFIQYISMENNLPNWAKTKIVKNIMLLMMMTMMIVAVIMNSHDIYKLGKALFRMMAVSSLMGIVLGVFFKPRSWCQICPMGHATALITDTRKGLTSHL